MSDQEDKDLQENQNFYELNGQSDDNLPRSLQLSGMYKNWFLDYASYVILERAVPHINDGLKPVQRRILHAMKELDDGRFNKVANIIGNTMKYHPHGDASINDALVQIGQKDILIDTQGNWGNHLTGDSAAAPRYIEARLSKFALEVLFNPKTTNWQLSYDGRNKEPITLPVKFPLLLAQGVEGIAVGLSSKILPHNFIELIDASIDVLKGKDFELYPDFPGGGMADVSKYNEGSRGSRVRIRAKITATDKKTLIITEIPFGTTTSSLIDSIINANDKGKIRIKKIEDNTAESIEIVIHLMPGVSPDQTIDALFAFTDCEYVVSPLCCIIEDQKPKFTSVKDILIVSVNNTVELLKKELEIQKNEALEHLHFLSLERIFIENEVYEDIKKCKTDVEIDNAIDKGLKPYTKELIRPVTNDDIKRLRKIPIERISKYNSSKADEIIKSIQDDLNQINHDLEHIIDFSVDYYKKIKKKYSQGKERKTELKNFDVIQATMVAATNQKLYVNREEGFAGTGLKKDEFVCDCSDIDDIIVFREDGTCIVTKISDKVFVGQNIIHIDVFRKNDERTIYNMIYRNGKLGPVMVKRFAILGVNRDKEYILTKGTKDSKVLYFTANPNGEAEIISVHQKPKPRLRILNFDFDFSTIAIKGRNSIGNILTKNEVRKISLKDTGVSTLGARAIWFDDSVLRLNTEQRGQYLGEFGDDDKIIVFTKSGYYKLYNYDLTNHFDDDLHTIEKFNPNKIYNVVYKDSELNQYYVKRFIPEILEKKVCFISESDGSELVHLSGDKFPRIEIVFDTKNQKSKSNEEVLLTDFIGVKGFKAKGKKLTNSAVKKINILESIPSPDNEEEPAPVTMEDNSDTEYNKSAETEETYEIIINSAAVIDENISEKKEKDKEKKNKNKEEKSVKKVQNNDKTLPAKENTDNNDSSDKPHGKQIEIDF